MARASRATAVENDDEGPKEYVVEEILKAKVGKRGSQKAYKYYVKWKGYGPKDNTWEPRESFASSPKLLDRFWARFDKGKPQIATLKGNEELTPGKPAVAVEDDDDDEEEEAPKRTPKAKRKSITKENPSPASTKRKRGRPSAAESTTSKRRKSNA